MAGVFAQGISYAHSTYQSHFVVINLQSPIVQLVTHAWSPLVTLLHMVTLLPLVTLLQLVTHAWSHMPTCSFLWCTAFRCGVSLVPSNGRPRPLAVCAAPHADH